MKREFWDDKNLAQLLNIGWLTFKNSAKLIFSSSGFSFIGIAFSFINICGQINFAFFFNNQNFRYHKLYTIKFMIIQNR